MKSIKLSIIFILLLVSIFQYTSSDTISSTEIDLTQDVNHNLQLNYAESPAISVRFNQDFVDQGFPGEGTPEDPYLISGYLINGWWVGIEVRDTNAYALISGNYISASTYHSIYSWNASNVRIENNIIDGTSVASACGISVHGESQNVSIKNNTVFDAAWGICVQNLSNHDPPGNIRIEDNLVRNIINEGITVTSALSNMGSSLIKDVSIINNIIRGADIGINLNSRSDAYTIVNSTVVGNVVEDCEKGLEIFKNYPDWSITPVRHNISNNLIVRSSLRGINVYYEGLILFQNNTIADGLGDGIYTTYGWNNTFTSNTVTNNSGDGIYITQLNAEYNVLTNNQVLNNGENGINIGFRGNNNFVLNNTIRNNTLFGIYFYGGITGSVASYNDLYFNNLAGDSQGVTRANSLFDLNFYNEWTEPDVDGDGIVDDPYLLDSSFGIYDNHPLAQPNNIGLFLTNLNWISNLTANPLSGSIEVQWSEVSDTQNHQIFYSVYYSIDGSTWIPLIQSISEPTYLWDTTTVPNGNYYLNITCFDDAELVISLVSDLITIDNPILTTSSTESLTSDPTETSEETSTVTSSEYPSTSSISTDSQSTSTSIASTSVEESDTISQMSTDELSTSGTSSSFDSLTQSIQDTVSSSGISGTNPTNLTIPAFMILALLVFKSRLRRRK